MSSAVGSGRFLAYAAGDIINCCSGVNKDVAVASRSNKFLLVVFRIGVDVDIVLVAGVVGVAIVFVIICCWPSPSLLLLFDNRKEEEIVLLLTLL